jgi:hypothetical protein
VNEEVISRIMRRWKAAIDTLNSEIARRFLQVDCKGFERLERYVI